MNLRTEVRVVPGVELYGLARNLFDKRYATFGSFFEPEAAEALGVQASDPRTISPGQPRAFYAGLRVRF